MCRDWFLVLWGVFVGCVFAAGGCQGEGSLASCADDADCLLKGEVCRVERCVLQATCNQDNDCKYKVDICKGGLCVVDAGAVTPPPKVCAGFCSSDGECRECNGGRTSCVGNACVKPERAGTFERCGTDVGQACKTGHLCVGSQNRYCFPECDLKQTRCHEGKGQCLDPNGAGSGVCFPDGQAKEGANCADQFTGDKALDLGKMCGGTLYCGNGTCTKPVVVGSYKRCSAGELCDETKATCVLLRQGESYGYCLPLCESNASSCEQGKGECMSLQSGKKVCLLKGSAKADARCGATGKELTSDAFCVSGLVCTAFSSGSLCLKQVSQCDASSCAQGRVCLPGSSGGACVLNCTRGCPGSLSCRHLHAGGGHFDVCVP